MTKKTPEQIAAMEEEVRQFRMQEAQAAVEERRKEIQPLLDFVESDEFRAVEARLPELEPVLLQMRDFRVHFDALRVGIEGLSGARSMFPAIAPAPEMAAPASVADAAK